MATHFWIASILEGGFVGLKMKASGYFACNPFFII